MEPNNAADYLIAGGLQVCVNRKWATVCRDEWDDKDNNVACRQLGFSYGGSEFNLRLWNKFVQLIVCSSANMMFLISCNLSVEFCQNSCFGNIATNPSYYRFKCQGNEAKLVNCRKEKRNSRCENAVGVYCGKSVAYWKRYENF